jgi:hypothetical protein
MVYNSSKYDMGESVSVSWFVAGIWFRFYLEEPQVTQPPQINSSVCLSVISLLIFLRKIY